LRFPLEILLYSKIDLCLRMNESIMMELSKEKEWVEEIFI